MNDSFMRMSLLSSQSCHKPKSVTNKYFNKAQDALEIIEKGLQTNQR